MPARSPYKSSRSFVVNGQVIVLTGSEMRVLSELSTGDTAEAIGARLFLARRTVEFHAGNAYRKLGVRNRVKALKLAIEIGAIGGGEYVAVDI